MVEDTVDGVIRKIQLLTNLKRQRESLKGVGDRACRTAHMLNLSTDRGGRDFGRSHPQSPAPAQRTRKPLPIGLIRCPSSHKGNCFSSTSHVNTKSLVGSSS